MADKNIDVWGGLREKLANAYSINIDSIESEARAVATRPPGAASAELLSGTSIARRTASSGVIPPLEDTNAAYTTQGEMRKIEQQFDEFLKLVESCRSFRREYAEDARLYLEVRLGLEEFFRIDAIHQQEVAAGAYELPWKDAVAQHQSTSERLAFEKWNENALTEVFKAPAQLDSASVEAFIARNGEAARQSSNREEARAPTADVAKFRIELDRRQWVKALEDSKAEVKSLTAIEAAMKSRAAYLGKDIGFRQARAAIARDLSYVKRLHHIAVGGPLNYAERIMATRALFNRYLVNAVDRALSIADGARRLYGLEIDRPELVDHKVLDSLSDWAQRTQELLGRRRRRERVACVSISIAGRFDRFRSRLDDGISMELKASDFLNLSGAMLRGVAVELITSDATAVASVLVTPPGEPNALPFGRVTASRDAPAPQFVETVWNRSALGTWAVKAATKLSMNVTDLVVTAWVAYVPE